MSKTLIYLIVKLFNSMSSLLRISRWFINEGEGEIIQIKEDSYSYHYLNKYEHFDIISETFIKHLEILNKEDIELKSLTIRYINVLDIEDEIPESRLVQLYPKYSSDRKIKKFQNSVNFNYNENQDIDVNVVTTKPNDNYIILDISARKNIKENEHKNQIINKVLVELREVKNKAFYDSITAKALLKYI
jgi:uncharacterized protein (TIGR04255 family)